jgi:predicted DNA-binding protein
MRSVRLSPELDARIKTAAKRARSPVSAFIRDAIERHCDLVLAESLAERLGDDIGRIASGAKARRFRNHKEEFTHVMARKNSRTHRKAG